MSGYTVQMEGGSTIIESVEYMFKMIVQRNRQVSLERNTALIEATLYKEEGAFVRDCNYLFEAIDSDNIPVCNVKLDVFKSAVDFFFTSILGTDLYVQYIPKASSLCGEQLKAFQFETR
ncbi:hypothetical protein IDJ77_11460 [Mucilaginibacter sp. ZT4R22]|uniref:Uncharacterized protein n=1 Tax=Mucilaginibacter pankratovii TaxID=2772110 RepID=A0ABR7WQ23_9SPHI|nr:hypothetical protein [Mucilaginibacter pankratovii]MBD1364426.1 hypothetical protein [Mucilaginibacter pankratovii]